MKKYLLCSFLLLCACGETNDVGGSAMSTDKLVQIKIGEPVRELVSKSKVKFEQDCLPQANICFYKIDNSFGDDDLPSVVVNDSFRVDQVVGVRIAVNQDVGDVVEDLELTIKSIPSNSRHEEYQAFIYGLIGELKKAGWTHYYAPSDPRISGAQKDKIASPNEVLGQYVLSHPWLDPGYEINMGKWLQVGKFYNWNFYSHGNYLTLRAWRRDSDDAPNDRATYLITLIFKSESAYWRAAFKENERSHWKDLLPELLRSYGAERKALEDRAGEAGIEIDSSYQDPPIKALK